MAFAPIALITPQYENYANNYLKAYDQGTTTPLSIATDVDGGTLLVKVQLDAQGFPITAGSARFIPFIDGDYDLWLFPTAAEADANDTTNAIQMADNLNADSSSSTFTNSIALLRLLEPGSTSLTVSVRGYYIPGDGGGGVFYWDSTSVETDNNGTIIKVTSVATGRYKRLYTGLVNVKWFGVVADWNGTTGTDNLTDMRNCFSLFSNILIPPGSYYISSKIDKAADNILVDATNAIFIFGETGQGGTLTGFQFGTSATDSIPNNKGLVWKGGTFRNFDRTEVIHRTYLIVQGMESFRISDVVLEDVSNGGIICRSGCRDGLIENVEIRSFSANSTLRGIWLDASDASDYQSFLVDTSTLARNATAVPIGGIRNVTIRNCTVIADTGSAYCVYLMNSQDTIIEDCYLNVNQSTRRCITVNTYSPRTIIRNNIIESNAMGAPNHGVYLTQFSHDCIIDGNTFKGNFDTGLPMNLLYLATANIINNNFLSTSAIQISVYMGASGRAAGNTFNSPSPASNNRCVRIFTIGNAEVALGYGDTAGILNGFIFENNDCITQNTGVQVSQQSSTGTNNQPGIDSVIVRNNTFRNWGNAGASQEYPLYVESVASPTNAVHYLAEDNVVFPSTSTYLAKNRAFDTNSAGVNIYKTGQNSNRGSGVWSPTLTDGTNDATTSTASASWVRIDKMIHIRGRITTTSLGSVTGVIRIGNLPFTSANDGIAGIASFGLGGGFAITAGTTITGFVPANTNYIAMKIWSLITGTDNMTSTHWSADGDIMFEATYYVD